MGQVRTKQDEITRTVIGDAIADQPLSMAVDDQGEFEFRVVVPIKGEFKIDSLKCQQRRRTGANFFKVRSHRSEFYSSWHHVSYTSANVAN